MRIDVDREADISHARIRTRGVAEALGFAMPAVEALATAVSELARNISEPGRGTTVTLKKWLR